MDLYRSCLQFGEAFGDLVDAQMRDNCLNVDVWTLKIQRRHVCGESPEVRFSMELTQSDINNSSWLGGDFFFLERKKKSKRRKARQMVDAEAFGLN